MPFICSICAEESTRICARCTKDACDNHLCEKCLRCSDCCECEVALSDSGAAAPLHSARSVLHPAHAALEPEPDPEPEPPHPPPDPDPVPQEEPDPGM
ncbi:MAG TPA: hypothetical protein VE959_28985 [Bryobacteraceae bacterium]|nr:hypothetical protein [Bryobacteraceae bacterium]